MTYVNIPVDPETKKRIVKLAEAFGFGVRGQGAMIRKLVNAEYDKLAAVKLSPRDEPVPALEEMGMKAEL